MGFLLIETHESSSTWAVPLTNGAILEAGGMIIASMKKKKEQKNKNKHHHHHHHHLSVLIARNALTF